MSDRRSETQAAVTVGLVGADEIVHRMMSLARTSQHAGLRLVPAVYQQESDAGEAARRVLDRVDVLLFAGPLPYDIAHERGELPVPATYVPAGGPALHGALLRGVLSGSFDPLRVSIDSASERDVRDTYDELGLSTRKVHVSDYHTTVTPSDYLKFHRSLFRDGKTSGAITTVPSVVSALEEDGIPCAKMTPSAATLRQALNTATLLGSGAMLEESQIAVVVVQLPTDALPVRTSPAQFWLQELRLSLHRELLQAARQLDAVVLPHDDRSFIVITTLGPLRLATDDLTSAPFLARASEVLKLDVEIGVGLGRTTVEAQTNAYTAVDRAADDHGYAYLVGPHEALLRLPRASDVATATETPAARPDSRELATLRTLVDGLRDHVGADGRDDVIDAERVATILNVTLRTARRTLQSLVQAGLAWPMPPLRSKKVGRPPMQYQLLTERLK